MIKLILILQIYVSLMVLDFSNKGLYNDVFSPYLATGTRYEIIYGSRSGGRSTFGQQKALIYHNLMLPYSKVVVIRKVYNTLKDSFYSGLVSLIYKYNLENDFHIIKSPLEIVNKKNGNQILFRGLDSPDKIKSIDNPTCAIYEEAIEISKKDFTTTSRTLRGPMNKTKIQEIFLFNPENERHWINKRFFPEKASYEKADGNFHRVKSIDPRAMILHTTYKDNDFLHPDIKKDYDLIQEYEPESYAVDALGLWGQGQTGLIFPKYQIIDIMPNNFDEIVYGLDFGTQNPSSLVEVRIKENDIYVKQLIYRRDMSTKELIEEMNELGVDKRAPIYADHELDRIRELKEVGGYSYVQPANKNVNDGIAHIQGVNIYIHASSMELISEMNNYIWAVTRAGILLDKPRKVHDHAVDAMRYAKFTHYMLYMNSNKPVRFMPPLTQSRFAGSNLFRGF